MSRRAVVVACLGLGLVVVPGVALADPPWQPPDGWVDQVRGDVCGFRGEPPCHTTTTHPTTTTQLGTSNTVPTATSTTGGTTGATTTTADVSGTSATSPTTTTTTTGVLGTTTASTTSATPGTTVTTGTTSGAVAAERHTAAPPPARVASVAADRGLASTGAAPLWTGVGGLVALLAGAVLLLFGRRRRA
ncbi:LPXTG cell wall anchor domain-containing protein [Actinosynnema sp. NPDC053489]|uniref:LPXTG cell wall anchor domain-containing protein n=1 Tax=Actinosynnema sp. NPDC053489 TaxID=3363916 RepID=UPI0037C7AD59